MGIYQKMKGNKKDFSKDVINLEIKTNKDKLIKIEKEDDVEDDNDETTTCGAKDDFTDIEIIKKKKEINRNICNKCKKEKSNFFIRAEFVCKTCFFKNINHKFRSNLRVKCKIRHEDTTLVCISGGLNSMSMAHWFDLSFNNDTSQKKMLFKIKFLHVDNLFLLEKFSKLRDDSPQEKKDEFLK